MTAGAPPKPASKEQLQLARCAFLDAFADAEAALNRLAKRMGYKSCAMTVGQRLDDMGKAKAGPTFSKAKVQALNDQLDRLRRLNVVRADIVHARLAVAPIAGQNRACFINSINTDDDAPVARLVTCDEFARFNRELSEVAAALALL